MSQTSPRIEEIAIDLLGVLAEPLRVLDDAALLAQAAAFECLGRLVDAGRVGLAGEIAHRSRSELGDEGLSRSENFATPVKLVAAVTGASAREARGRLDLGRRLRCAEQLGGVPGALPFPAVTAALEAGELGLECAAIITRECAWLTERGLGAESVAEVEASLVDAAGRTARNAALGPDEVARLAVRVREHLDPDGSEPREEQHGQLRALTLIRSSDGMIRGRIALTPEQGALWISATQAVQSPRVPPRFTTEDEFVQEQITADTRTGPQRLVDAATELIARAATAPGMQQLSGATTTVNVHVSLADLEAGCGPGWVDGLDEPLPMSVVERLRCHSPVAVTVFGERGEVLHHGKTRRLFSPAQNRALAARDGGCVWPGCDRPPSWCETHHAQPWQSPDYAPGRTDLDNGVLLCHFHHAHLHNSSWKLVMLAGVPHVVPPGWIDTDQVPIPVTRRRTRLAGSAGIFPAGVVTAAHSWLESRGNAPPRASAA
jgi:hypothetical protein